MSGRRRRLRSGAAVAVVVSALGGCGEERLSGAARAEATGACQRYRHAVGPHEFGSGFGELAVQARSYRVAREELAGRLRRIGEDDADREALDELAAMLRRGNALLVAAEQRAHEQAELRQPADDRSLVRSLRAFERQAAREADAAEALGLARCMET